MRVIQDQASKWLETNAEASSTLKNSREKVSKDFMVSAVLCIFAYQERDWQMRALRYGGRDFPTYPELKPLSKPRELTLVKGSDLVGCLK
jgi:hypothetical protein